MTDVISSILAINPDAQCQISDENIDSIIWAEGTNPITKKKILAKQVELRAAFSALAYSRARANSFPTWQEQMDMQYWDQVNGTTTWKDAVAKVKSDNPKPE